MSAGHGHLCLYPCTLGPLPTEPSSQPLLSVLVVSVFFLATGKGWGGHKNEASRLGTWLSGRTCTCVPPPILHPYKEEASGPSLLVKHQIFI